MNVRVFITTNVKAFLMLPAAARRIAEERGISLPALGAKGTEDWMKENRETITARAEEMAAAPCPCPKCNFHNN